MALFQRDDFVKSRIQALMVGDWPRFSHRTVVWSLVILGIVRTVVLLLAYPPAHGADSQDYFLYAERLAGMTSLENMANHVAPMHSYLIWLTYKVAGSAYLLIGLQLLMSLVIAPLYYLALYPYDRLFALIASLVIVFDPQVHVLFNLSSSEPLYFLFTALLVFGLLRGHYAFQHDAPGVGRYFLLAGIMATLLLLTRPPAKLLFVPVIVLVLLMTRRWPLVLRAAAGVAIALVLYSGISLGMTGRVEGLLPGLGMLRRAATEISGDAASANAEQRPGEGGDLVRFIGNQVNLLAANLPVLIPRFADGILDYVALSGRQLGWDAERPGEAQCAGYPYDAASAAFIDKEVIDTRFDPLPPTDQVVADVRQVWPQILNALCPELPHSDQARAFVNWLLVRYRSLGRPQEQIPFWYGGVILLPLISPRLRKFWPIVAVLGTLLLYHAAVSASVIDVQPRYVVPMNPIRAILLLLLPYQVLYWLAARYVVAMPQERIHDEESHD